jgi:integrase/recombinase XerD
MDINHSIHFNKYIEHLVFNEKSTKNIKYSLRLLFEYLDENCIDLLRIKINEAEDFQGYLVTTTDKKGKIKYTKRSVSSIIGAVTGFYTYLKKEKLIHSNPFLEIKKIRNPKSLPKNILTEENMSKLLNHLKAFSKGKNLIERRQLYKAHVVAELMYSTGMRINEVMKLKEEDVDLVRGTVKITDSKSREIRDGILNEYCQKVLRIYIEKVKDYIIFGKNEGDASLLFGTKANLKMYLNSLLQKECKKLKLGSFTTHHFRHAVGYHLLRSGCDIRFIQEVLGHKVLTSTQIYTKVDKNDLRNVIDKYHPRKWRRK